MSKIIWVIMLCILLLTGCATMESDWNSAKKYNTEFSYDSFLQKYPESPYTNEAKVLRDKSAWDITQWNDTPKQYDEYLRRYPHGKYTDEAKKRIEPAHFKQAQKTDSISSYENFIMIYPNSIFVKEARARIEELKKEVVLEAEFYEKLNKLDNQTQIENLIDSYSQYKFIERAIPKVEDMIIAKIKKNGPGRDRFVAKIYPLTGLGIPTIRNTIWCFVDEEKYKKNEAWLYFGSGGAIFASFGEDVRIRKSFWTSDFNAYHGFRFEAVGLFIAGQDFPGDFDKCNVFSKKRSDWEYHSYIDLDWGDNSIFRFGDEGDKVQFSALLKSGKKAVGIKFRTGGREDGYIFHGKGNRLHRLTFLLTKQFGAVYVRGKGQVISPKGEIFNF